MISDKKLQRTTPYVLDFIQQSVYVVAVAGVMERQNKGDKNFDRIDSEPTELTEIFDGHGMSDGLWYKRCCGHSDRD